MKISKYLTILLAFLFLGCAPVQYEKYSPSNLSLHKSKYVNTKFYVLSLENKAVEKRKNGTVFPAI